MIEKVANVFIAVSVTIMVILFICFLFKGLFIVSPLPNFYKYNYPLFTLIYPCIVAPFAEELLFRHIAIQLLKKTEFFKENSLYIIIGLGMIFGWVHGSFYNVYIQGIAGIAFGWVYLKNGYCYLSAVGAHALYNIAVAFVIPSVI